jgi:hypothetical protein
MIGRSSLLAETLTRLACTVIYLRSRGSVSSLLPLMQHGWGKEYTVYHQTLTSEAGYFEGDLPLAAAARKLGIPLLHYYTVL